MTNTFTSKSVEQILALLYIENHKPDNVNSHEDLMELFQKEGEFWKNTSLKIFSNYYYGLIELTKTFDFNYKEHPHSLSNYIRVEGIIPLLPGKSLKMIYSNRPETIIVAKFDNYEKALGGYHYLIDSLVLTVDRFQAFQIKKPQEYITGIFETIALTRFSDQESFKKRRKAERQSLSSIRSQYTKLIAEDEEKKITVSKEINFLIDTANSMVNKYDSSIKDLTTKCEDFINEQKISFEKAILDEMKSSTDVLKETMNAHNDKMKSLEETYQNYLRLGAPAKYWKELYKEYETKGKSWKTYALVSTGILTIILFTAFFFYPSNWLPESGAWNAVAIKGTLILTTIVSALVYIIRLFVKFSTSAFHLSRDARERYQLTHSFLALEKQGALKEDDRLIILQSIFSRSDTGLLKHDSQHPLQGVITKLTEK